uniref:Uncharacterized protein n=1 Tax=Amphimedon queenslandica TaxID=400682 RepID=A0A1X7TTW0_AMPQE
KYDERLLVMKGQLQSLVGLLNYAARIVSLRRPFTWSLMEALKIPQEPDHWVRLNVECSRTPCSASTATGAVVGSGGSLDIRSLDAEARSLLVSGLSGRRKSTYFSAKR